MKYYVAKVENKNLFLNTISYGFEGEEKTYFMISRTPLLFDGRNDLKETLDYIKSDFCINKMLFNEIDDYKPNPKDLIIKKVELNVK